MKLLLLNPTIVFKREHLHIGLTTIGTYVRQRSDHRVRILDFMAHRRRWRGHLRRVLDEFRPDVVGMYVSSPYFAAARAIAREIKAAGSRAFVMAGGHHPTLVPGEVMAEGAFDGVIVGEGEKPTLTLLDTMEAGSSLEGVPGLWWRDRGAIRRQPKDTLIRAEEIPAPDWSLHDEEDLRHHFYFWGILPAMGSRGCPARCAMCSITNVQRLYKGERFMRFRDPVAVCDEVEAGHERYRPYGARVLFFYDLNFLVNPKWVRAFTDEYKRRGLNERLPWSAFTRGDHVTPAMVDCLRDSGCVNLRIGIEAANPFMRNAVYRKELPQDELEDCIRQVKALGITVTGYILAGGPGERPEWLVESLDFVHRHGVDFPVFFQFKALAEADVLKRAADLGSEVREEVVRDSPGDFLHGVDLTHRHLTPWKLDLYLLYTHVLFGPRLVAAQVRRTGFFRYAGRMARYLARAVRHGFTLYGALTYFIFYGDDHLQHPARRDPSPRPGRWWRAAMAFARAWLGHSGEPPPPAVPEVPREQRAAAGVGS